MAIRGGKAKSMKTLKSSLKRKSSENYLKRIPNEGITIRFMTEPDEFFEYYEYWDPSDKAYYPEVEGVEPNIEPGRKPAKRFLANAVDISEGKVIPLVLPATALAQLVKKYDKYGTILDRDYEINREGTGIDTEYDVTPEPASAMKMSRFKELDLQAVLESQLPGANEDEDEDEVDEDEEDEAPRRSAKRKVGGSSRKRPVDDEDEDEDEDEDDEPVRRPSPKKRPVKKRPVKRRG